ncbi:MAG: hypothetical protein WD200_05075 [Candidatus Andersenbacteria bacterium]
MLSRKQLWFVSHPSGSPQHTPTFFNAINRFAEEHPDIKVVLPHKEEDEVQLTKDEIAKADLVLVEVSIPSTGSGIELGWANAAKKEIIAFHHGGSEPSPALKFVTSQIIIYVSEDDIISNLQDLA